jgi:hypothetical protein
MRTDNPEKRRVYQRNYYKEYLKIPKNRESLARIQSKYHLKVRLLLKENVLSHYGNEKLACVKCGYSDIRALSIDFIQGGHSGSGFPSGQLLYRYLKRNGYPKGWQTLCMNCQYIKRDENHEYANLHRDLNNV